MLKELIIPTTIAAALAATPVLADQTSKTGGESQADRQSNMQDNSSVPSGERGDQTFSQLDKNTDGKLDENELNAWGSTAAGGTSGTSGAGDTDRGERILNRYDLDDDGSVTKRELDQGPKKQDDM